MAQKGSGPPPDESVRPLWDQARAAFPDVPLPYERFSAYLQERIPPDADLDQTLADTHGADLYLACACAGGEPTALATFERQYFPQVVAHLHRQNLVPDFIEEVMQELRTRLLVAESGASPRIASYTGRGPLLAWLRVAAVRASINLRQSASGAGARSAAETLEIAAAVDPELALLRARYGDVVRQAIAAALQALDRREALVLRLHFLEGVSTEAIGALYRASQRTARRWIADAREKIVDETRRRLAAELDASTTQLDSIIRLVHADLEPSIVNLLEKPKSS